MPDAMPARLTLDQALDQGLVAMFHRMQSESVPAALLRLADRLEAASRSAFLASETSTIG